MRRLPISRARVSRRSAGPGSASPSDPSKEVPSAVIKRSAKAIAATWVAGLLILLPLALTFAVLAWAFGLVNRFVGPSSSAGRMFAAIGYPFTSHPGLQYLSGTLLLVVSIYVLGLIVQSGLKGPLRSWSARAVKRIPIVGAVYT